MKVTGSQSLLDLKTLKVYLGSEYKSFIYERNSCSWEQYSGPHLVFSYHH